MFFVLVFFCFLFLRNGSALYLSTKKRGENGFCGADEICFFSLKGVPRFGRNLLMTPSSQREEPERSKDGQTIAGESGKEKGAKGRRDF